MGAYTDNLMRRRKQTVATVRAVTGEHLVACAIIRDGVLESRGFKAHWEIREALGDNDPTQSKPGDDEGFLTSEGRFVNRHEAVRVAAEAGQIRGQVRPLLSSDIW